MDSKSIVPSKLIWSFDKRKRVMGIICSLLVLVLFKKQLKSSFAKFITEHRGIFVTLFVLPVSFGFDIFWFIRGRVYRLLYSAPLRHDQRVQEIRKQISRYPTNQAMCTGRAGWLTMSPTVAKYKQTMRPIRMDLYDILHLDTQRRVVRVEPLVTTGQLTAALLPQGWTLPVVPELDELTIGGLIMGFGVETSSHKHGLFQYTCVSHELILPDGRLVKCSAEENPELFYSVPWSHGTIGFLVASEIRIIPAKKYVKLTYQPTFSRAELIDAFEKAIRNDSFDFVEALVYSDNEAIVMTGTMTDSVEPQKLNEIGRYYKPWFYKHCHKFLSDKQGAKEEYLPLRDYYHRHTRSLFWEMEDIIPFGNNVLYRHLVGWLLPPKIGLLKLTRTDALRELYEKNHVVQDMLIPLSTLSESLQLFRHEFNIYPLWLCPMKIFKTPHKGLINPRPDEDMFVDIGAYGRPRVEKFIAKESLRRVEKYVRDVHGFQALYADTYMNRKEFREMFDHSLHDELRERYNCVGKLPEIYDKVSKDARQ